MTGKRVVVKNNSVYHHLFYLGPIYSCIGSIIGWYETPQTIVWGSGLISNEGRMEIPPKKICSVRGPETRKRLLEMGINCPEQYGDPALLISRYYTAIPLSRKYKIGVIPHHSDIDNLVLRSFVEKYPDDVLLINLTTYKHWTDIPNMVVSCDCILSSSLHGLIVADSYGVPNSWVGLSDKVYGGDFKFNDYFSSVQRREKQIIIKSIIDLESLLASPATKCDAVIDYEAIAASAPFTLKQQ
jgi:pyruvyltransferase